MWKRVIGHFQVAGSLSKHGATSLIYLAHDPAIPHQQVVIKQARRGWNQVRFQERIRHEAAVLQRLRMPGVVSLFPVWDEDVYCARDLLAWGKPWYFAMEYLTTPSVFDHKTILAGYSLEWRWALFQQVQTVVNMIHQQGYVHLDLKPEHIFLTDLLHPSVIPTVKLIDFGSAAVRDEPLPHLMLTPPYTAPVVLQALVRGDDLPPASAKMDQWSLGALLYELLTGKRLIQANRPLPALRETDQIRGVVQNAPLSDFYRTVIRDLLEM